VLFNAPPVILNICVLIALAEVSVPALIAREFKDAVEPKFSDPPETVSCPEDPFKLPFSAALPPLVTVSPPPREVMPVTVSEPPETVRELPLLMVKLAIVSVPVVCVTAIDELIRTESKDPGTTEPLQLVANAQSNVFPTLVKVYVEPTPLGI
jgi:hypothetical protein